MNRLKIRCCVDNCIIEYGEYTICPKTKSPHTTIYDCIEQCNMWVPVYQRTLKDFGLIDEEVDSDGLY